MLTCSHSQRLGHGESRTGLFDGLVCYLRESHAYCCECWFARYAGGVEDNLVVEGPVEGCAGGEVGDCVRCCYAGDVDGCCEKDLRAEQPNMEEDA